MKVTSKVKPVIRFDGFNELLERWFWDEANLWFINGANHPSIEPLVTVTYTRHMERIDPATIPALEEFTDITLRVGCEQIHIEVFQQLHRMTADVAREAIKEAVGALRHHLIKS